MLSIAIINYAEEGGGILKGCPKPKCWNQLKILQKEIKKLQSELKAKDNQISDLKRSKKEANYYLNQQLSQVLNENEDIRRELEIYKSNAFLQKIKSEQDTVKKLTEPIKNQVFDLLSKVRR